jgi:hypothetical protein
VIAVTRRSKLMLPSLSVTGVTAVMPVWDVTDWEGRRPTQIDT